MPESVGVMIARLNVLKYVELDVMSVSLRFVGKESGDFPWVVG